MCGGSVEDNCPACGVFVTMIFDDEKEVFECPKCEAQFKDKNTPIRN